MNDDDKIDRRRFFREGLRQIFGRVEKAAEPVQRFAAEFAKLDRPMPSKAEAAPAKAARAVTLPLILRPPGALGESDFLGTCSRCGDCVRACPAECIVLDGSAGGGAPHIIAESKACVMCDELSCMNVCATGALQLVPRFAIRMGRAVWGEGKCVRGNGEDCRACLDVCPLGTAAIELNETENSIMVKDACTGCGQCQFVCPTTPRAIVVVPTR